MKATFLILALFVSSLAIAQQGPQTEPGPVTKIEAGHGIVRAFMQNPQISAELKKNYLSEVRGMTTQLLSPGVTEYQLHVSSCGNCMPKRGVLTIIEDMRPTYADGAIKYDIKLSIDK